MVVRIMSTHSSPLNLFACELAAKPIIQAGPQHVLIQGVASPGAEPHPFELRAHVWCDAVFNASAGSETRVQGGF